MPSPSALSKTPNGSKSIARIIAPYFIYLLGFSFGMMHGCLTAESRRLTGFPRVVASSDCNTSPAVDAMTPIIAAAAELNKKKNVTSNNDDDGWRSIQVFYGQIHNEPATSENRLWFSQAQQDQLVLGLLRNQRDGFFIDLAASDAVHFSNTFALERLHGWKGICVEPNPVYWAGFARHRTCQLAAAIVGEERMEPVELPFNRGVMGGSQSRPSKDQETSKQVSADELERFGPMYTVPLSEILHRMNAPAVIEYLSLDVEGSEFFIMKLFPLQSYRIKIMTVERPDDDLKNHLFEYGYLMILKISFWGETLWVHKDYLPELDLSILEPEALAALV